MILSNNKMKVMNNVSISLKNHSIADEIILITFYKEEIQLSVSPCMSIKFEFDYCDIQLLQKILTDIKINKRTFTVFHKDFIDNPKKVIDELHKLEEKCKNSSR